MEKKTKFIGGFFIGLICIIIIGIILYFTVIKKKKKDTDVEIVPIKTNSVSLKAVNKSISDNSDILNQVTMATLKGICTKLLIKNIMYSPFLVTYKINMDKNKTSEFIRHFTIVPTESLTYMPVSEHFGDKIEETLYLYTSSKYNQAASELSNNILSYLESSDPNQQLDYDLFRNLFLARFQTIIEQPQTQSLDGSPVSGLGWAVKTTNTKFIITVNVTNETFISFNWLPLTNLLRSDSIIEAKWLPSKTSTPTWEYQFDSQSQIFQELFSIIVKKFAYIKSLINDNPDVFKQTINELVNSISFIDSRVN